MADIKNEYRKFFVERLSYFRVQSKLSGRELSNRMGKSDGYIAKFEMGGVNMPSETLMDAMTILSVPPEKFFCKYPEKFEEEAELLEKWRALSDENKKFFMTILEKLR